MKKIRMMIYVCFMLCACTNNPDEITTKKVPDPIETKDEALTYTNTFFGFGTKEGFYHITQKDDGKGTACQNIRYFDYASKKEIYLCDKPECDHMNETCTSYLVMNSEYSLFSYDDNLYLIENGNGSNAFQIGDRTTQGEEEPARIYKMDKDGKNRTILCELKDGFQFEQRMVVLGNNSLYIQVILEENIAVNDNTHMAITSDKKMMNVDLSTGEQHEVLNMKNKFFIGADGHKLLIEQLHYQEDLDALLARNDYDGYDKAILEADISYSLFDTKTSAIEENVLGDIYNPYIYHAQLYYINNQNELCNMDSSTREFKVLETFESGYQYELSGIMDGHIQIDVWSTDKSEAQFLKTLVYTIDKKTLTTQQLTFQEPKEPFTILGYNDTSYFMKYKQDGHMETTWAGTQQFTQDALYYGLINKEDYWNDKANFTDIVSVSQ